MTLEPELDREAALPLIEGGLGGIAKPAFFIAATLRSKTWVGVSNLALGFEGSREDALDAWERLMRARGQSVRDFLIDFDIKLQEAMARG